MTKLYVRPEDKAIDQLIDGDLTSVSVEALVEGETLLLALASKASTHEPPTAIEEHYLNVWLAGLREVLNERARRGPLPDTHGMPTSAEWRCELRVVLDKIAALAAAGRFPARAR